MPVSTNSRWIPRQPKVRLHVVILVISPGQSDREDVILTCDSAVAVRGKASLPSWTVPSVAILSHPLHRRGPGSGMAGTKVTLELGKSRKNGNFVVLVGAPLAFRIVKDTE